MQALARRFPGRAKRNGPGSVEIHAIRAAGQSGMGRKV